MKANELSCKDLMVGDWVKPKNVDVSFRVGFIGVESVWNDKDTHEWWYDEIEPIPLTTEILEKNGFIKDADEDDRVADMYHLLVPTGFERNSFTIQVSLYREPICGVSTLVKCYGWIPPYNGGMNDIHLCSANYVHQLQHAMRLCGIDKEIEL